MAQARAIMSTIATILGYAMNRFPYGMLLLLAHLGVSGSSASAQSTAVDNARSTAKKDYVSAQAKILQDYKYAIDQCSKWTGPGEKACKIQAQAKREADEEDAKLTVDRAGYAIPLPDQARKKASDEARARAKNDHKVAIGKVDRTDRIANTECSKLDGPDRKTCVNEVATRTANAKRQAKYNYAREMDRAKATAGP
jgi:hypothetical protein